MINTCLDVEIQSADKYLVSNKRMQEFLDDECIIEQKIDGVKLSLVLKDQTGDYTKDWIVSYKGWIQYPDEFNYAGLNNIKSNSISNSQFRLVFEHLKNIDTKLLPINTEFFVEYIMVRPDVLSDYDTKHKMVLLAYSSTVFEEYFGRLKSKPTSFKTIKRDNYARILKMHTPSPLFVGFLNEFENGIVDEELKSKFLQTKNLLDINNITDYLDKIKNLLLSVSSKFGGKEEGVVITNSYGVFKWQQPYQKDDNIRTINKNKYKGTAEEESVYSNNIRLSALNIVNQLQQPFKQEKLNEILNSCAESLLKLKLEYKHPKKTDLQIKDDIHSIIKTIIIKSLKGNNNFLFISRFNVLTNIHYNMIKEAAKKYDSGVICIVSNKDTINTRKLREQMVKACFPDLEIIHSNNASLLNIIKKCDININAVVCGQDRYLRFKEILKLLPDIKTHAIKVEGIKSSSIVENINNELLFNRNTPEQVHQFYKKLKSIYETKEQND